jgi:hypothetical protein
MCIHLVGVYAWVYVKCQHAHTYIPVTEAGSRSLVLCNTKVPESTTMSPQSTDTILLAL